MMNIRKSFSAKLNLAVLLLAIPIFTGALGVLFYQSRLMIKREAMGRADSMLDDAMQHLSRNLMVIETGTDANCWLVVDDLRPEALKNLSHYIVRMNGHIDGCSISLEPDIFPEYGRFFSAYSIREGDSITTVIEKPYDYFQKIWYKNARELGKPCWVSFYDETDSLDVTLNGMIASYCRPIYDASHRFIGIISTDLTIEHLYRIVLEEKAYPNSYFMLVDKEGNYFVHPDSTRITQSAFSYADPMEQADLIALGHEMTSGRQGNMSVVVDGVPSYVCYRPVRGTTWSLAMVCPYDEVLRGYYRLTYIILPILAIGLFIILLQCHRSVTHSIHPLNQLLAKAQTIASGNMEVHIPHSNREDAVGRLQNSFGSMLRALQFHMGSVRYITDQARRRNEELEHATRLAKEAEHQKTVFIQNVTHQIRTPLNVIMGFAQVLSDMVTASGTTLVESMPKSELKDIADTMNHHTKVLSRMVLMLYDSSDTGRNDELHSHKHDMVPCNDVVHEAIGYINMHYPDLPIKFQTDVDDDFCIETNRLYLMRSLRELLYNAGKYSDGEHVSISITHTDTTVRFIVEDRGKGISQADHDLMFKFFAKVDDLSEGLGLGLPLAKRHVQTLGGDLILDETFTDGCRFIIEIPLTAMPEDPSNCG